MMYELTIDNLAGVTLSSGNLSIRSRLFLVNGNLNLAGNQLIFMSDASGDAQLAPVLNGNIIGNATVQRYIDAGATNWRYLASPVVGVDFEQWDDNITTSGFIGSDYPTFNFVSIYSYDESIAGIFQNGYTPLTNSNQPLLNGQGFVVWSGTGSTTTNPFTIDVNGQLAIGI